jgi:hypothetical protein
VATFPASARPAGNRNRKIADIDALINKDISNEHD